MHTFFIFLSFLALTHNPQPSLSLPCRTQCGAIDIRYPFGVDDGCGAPQFRRMLNCTATDLSFTTPSGTYKVQHIDYKAQTLELYDPSMSTCSILQPHHDFAMSPLQSYIIPPTPDTVFALLNCSIDSPILNRYSNLCFNVSGHSCNELYDTCNSFRVFRLGGNGSSPEPPCCFTGYDTVKYMSMNILDCSHYTSFVDGDGLRGIGALDWVYGIKLSYGLPETGCRRCEESGGTCGFDTETEGMLCLCSASANATRQCGMGRIEGGGGRRHLEGRMLGVVIVGVLSVLLWIFGLL